MRMLLGPGERWRARRPPLNQLLPSLQNPLPDLALLWSKLAALLYRALSNIALLPYYLGLATKPAFQAGFQAASWQEETTGHGPLAVSLVGNIPSACCFCVVLGMQSPRVRI